MLISWRVYKQPFSCLTNLHYLDIWAHDSKNWPQHLESMGPATSPRHVGTFSLEKGVNEQFGQSNMNKNLSKLMDPGRPGIYLKNNT